MDVHATEIYIVTGPFEEMLYMVVFVKKTLLFIMICHDHFSETI